MARAWTGLWAIPSGRALPAAIPEKGADILRQVAWDRDDEDAFTASLLESRLDGTPDESIRDEVREIADLVLQHPYLR